MSRYALVLLLILAAPCALAESIDDPWSLVPAFPSSCYSAEDDFNSGVQAAMDRVSAEQVRRSEINQSISQQYSNMDLMEQQQRMMEFMMEHPEEAQSYMQGLAQMGQEASAEAVAMSNERIRLEEELREITARFEAAYQEVIGVLDARWGNWITDWNNSRATEDQAREIYRQMNASYEALCETWWKNGPFHDWLARHRQVLIEEAREQDAALPSTIRTYELMGIAVDEYSSTASLQAANEHMQKAANVFGRRWPEARKYVRGI